MIYRLLVAGLFGFLFISCSSETRTDLNTSEIFLVKTDSIILDQADPLYGKFYEHFKISNSGDVWVFADRLQEKLFVFNKIGEFLTVIGERGKGPKEIMRIAGFDINSKNEVWVYDSSQRMLKIFDLKGNLLHSSSFLDNVQFGTTPFAMQSYRDRILTAIIENQYMFEPSESKLLAMITVDGKVDTLFGKFDPFTKHDNNYNFFNEIAIDENSEEAYVNLVSSPHIQSYNLTDFNKETYFGESSQSFSIPEKEIHSRLPITEVTKRATNTSHVAGLFLTDKYIIQHLQILTEEWFELTDYSLKKNILVVYDKNTRKFIKEISTPYTLGAVKNNRLYFIEDFNPDKYSIGVYEFIERK